MTEAGVQNNKISPQYSARSTEFGGPIINCKPVASHISSRIDASYRTFSGILSISADAVP